MTRCWRPSERLETLAASRCKEFLIDAELGAAGASSARIQPCTRDGTRLAVTRVPHTAASTRLAMPILSDGRPLAHVATAALTVYDVVSVAIWALLLFLVARRSKSSILRDLFGLVVAVAAVNAS